MVLFPRMPLQLHIFEPRYKHMIGACIEDRRPFGALLIREGSEVGEPASPHSVGCTARIVAVQALDDGKMNLFCEGADRFRVIEHWEEQAGSDDRAGRYLVGIVEAVEDAEFEREEAGALIVEIAEMFGRYFEGLIAQTGMEMPDYDLPTDPVEFSFVIASVLPMDNDRRQAMLQSVDTVARLAEQRDMLVELLSKFEGDPVVRFVRAKPFDPAEMGMYHSLN